MEDGKWLLVSPSRDTFAPGAYFVAEHLWPWLCTGIQRVQHHRRGPLVRRRLGPLSEFVKFARGPRFGLPSDVIEKIIEETVT